MKLVHDLAQYFHMLGHVHMALPFRSFFSLYQGRFGFVAQTFHALQNPICTTFSQRRRRDEYRTNKE